MTASDPPDVKIQAILDRIKPVSEVKWPFSCLFYGRSGTGKTTLAGTFPGPVIILDSSEQGTDSVADVEGAKVIKLEAWDDFETMYWMLKSSKHPYKTVVVDTVTQLQKLATEYVLEQNNKEKTAPMNKHLWSVRAQLLTAWFISYRDLPMNVVFLAQDKNAEEEEGAAEDQIIQEVGPRLSPSVAASLNAAVKIIGQTYIKEYIKQTPAGPEKIISFRLRIGPNSRYLTKVRKIKGLKIPNSINDPSYEKLMKAITPAPAAESQPEAVNSPKTE